MIDIETLALITKYLIAAGTAAPTSKISFTQGNAAGKVIIRAALLLELGEKNLASSSMQAESTDRGLGLLAYNRRDEAKTA